MYRSGRCGEAHLVPLLAGGQAETEDEMGPACSRWTERDAVLATFDELAARQLHRQCLVE